MKDRRLSSCKLRGLGFLYPEHVADLIALSVLHRTRETPHAIDGIHISFFPPILISTESPMVT